MRILSGHPFVPKLGETDTKEKKKKKRLSIKI